MQEPYRRQIEDVGWVEQKMRVVNALFLRNPSTRHAGPMMGFAITREERIIALPILRK